MFSVAQLESGPFEPYLQVYANNMQKFVTKIGKGPFADEVQPTLKTWWETGVGVQVRVQVEEKGQGLDWCTQQRRKTSGSAPSYAFQFWSGQ